MILPSRINYRLIEQAISYYQSQEYKRIEVPWVVSAEAMNITCPEAAKAAAGIRLVASGEQSFLQMILDKELKPGKYVCATPCWRPWDEMAGALHYTQFFKVELIHYLGDAKYDESASTMVTLALNFFNTMLRKQGLHEAKVTNMTDEKRRGCTTLQAADIEILTTGGWMELGSYGVRKSPSTGLWVYGTGLALPRFEEVAALARK